MPNEGPPAPGVGFANTKLSLLSFLPICPAVVTLLLVSLSEASRSSLCQIWKSDIQRSEEDVKVSRNYKGLWLSEKCEILPGPQFQLRRYHFLRNGKFHLTRYYYSDPWCSLAAFSVTVVGNFHPSPEKATTSSASWVVPGGLELDFTLRKMILVPFTMKDAMILSDKVNSSCPGIVMMEWKPYKKYKVLNYEDHGIRKRVHHSKFGLMEDIDCTSSLGITFNELQLVRLEHRIPLRFMTYHRLRDHPEGVSRRYQSFLYLGADGRNPRNRPTYYQVPLLSSQVQSCSLCRILSKASAVLPPELSPEVSPFPPSTDLDGHWISLRCEVRPYGLFLKREFFFNSKSRHWTGHHEYFKDPQCKNPMFTLAAEGLFSIGQTSKKIPDAMHCDFEILDSTITPKDQQFASNLNGLPTCGTRSSWKVGETGNLSISGGCKELGISVPSTELELIRSNAKKSELMFLYLGDGSEEHKRPTSFQLPLVRCSSHEMNGAEDHNLLFNDLQPLPLVSGSPLCFHHFEQLLLLLVFRSFLLCVFYI